MNRTLIDEIKRCLRLYGACSLSTIADHLMGRGIIPDSTLPSILATAVERGELREVTGVKGRTLYALALTDTN